MQGGKKGLLVNTTNLCKRQARATAEFTGQNGKVHDFNPVAEAECCKKAKKRKRQRAGRRSAGGGGERIGARGNLALPRSRPRRHGAGRRRPAGQPAHHACSPRCSPTSSRVTGTAPIAVFVAGHVAAVDGGAPAAAADEIKVNRHGLLQSQACPPATAADPAGLDRTGACQLR